MSSWNEWKASIQPAFTLSSYKIIIISKLAAKTYKGGADLFLFNLV